MSYNSGHAPLRVLTTVVDRRFMICIKLVVLKHGLMPSLDAHQLRWGLSALIGRTSRGSLVRSNEAL